jgi:hypothetical protein
MGGVKIEPKLEFENGVATQLICGVEHLELNQRADIRYQLLDSNNREVSWGVLKMENEDYQLWDNDDFIYNWVKKQLNLEV